MAKKTANSDSYLSRVKSANASMGKKALAVRKGQSKAANKVVRGVGEVAAFISEGPKETRGKYTELGVSASKLAGVARALRAAGQIDRALGVEARVAAKALGGSSKAKGMYPGKAFLGETGQAAAKRARQSSEFVFPRAPKKGPMGQPDLGDLGAGRVGLPYNTPAQIRRANRARRATQAADRVYELEKRLNLPGTAPKRGR